MNEKIYLRQLLESDKTNLHFLIENGDSKNKLMREKMLEITKNELLITNEYLYKHCNHEIIIDHIDSLEKMEKIKYCNKCGLTLR